MNYKVLYRKYRPTNFDEIVGQDNVVELLKESIVNNKISHAYIFSGPRGTGKTSTAKIFAKAINCLDRNGSNPCNKCLNCLNFSQSSDVYEIDAASNNGVDQVREIIENIKLAPINSKYKVYIIDEVHMLSVSAFNALLLTLEEPPSHVVFILATTNVEDVPITVLSRCQRLDFKKISNDKISKALSNISKKENINIDVETINEIADYSDGGMRDALSILDQLSKTNKNISREIFLETIGAISTLKVEKLITAIENNQIDYIIKFVEELRSVSADFKTVIKRLIQVLKDRAINVLNKSYNNKMEYKQYKNLCFDLANLIYKNNVNVDSYVLLELCLLSYINDFEKGEENISREIKKVVNKEQATMEEVPKNRLGNKFDDLVNIRINNCFAGANKKLLQANKRLWNEFVSNLSNKKIKGILLDTEIVLASDKILVIEADFQEKADLINNNLLNIEELLSRDQNQTYNLISISKNRWEKEVENYKNNIKNKIIYQIKEEPKLEIRSELDDIFQKQKIEIK